LSEEGETFRWTTDAAMIRDLTPSGVGFGTPDRDALQDELDINAEFGLFGDGDTPTATDFLDDTLARIYDGSTVIWPS
jgi:hypothetical protein